MANLIGVPGLIKSIETGGMAFNRSFDEWKPRTQRQKAFLKSFVGEKMKDDSKASIIFASSGIQKFMESEGFQFKPIELSSSQFGLISMLNVLPEWSFSARTVNVNGYKGIEIERKKSHARIYSSPTKKNPETDLIIKVPINKSGDTVCMTAASNPLKGFDLFEEINRIKKGLIPFSFEESYGYLRFPEVSLNQLHNFKWLGGLSLSVDGKKAEVLTAFQHVKINLAIKETTPVLGEPEYYKKKTYAIDSPFYLWVEKPNMVYPSLCAYVDQGDWTKYS
jgi:hypothetical protein